MTNPLREINEQNPRYLEAKLLVMMFEDFDGHIWVDNNGMYALGVSRKPWTNNGDCEAIRQDRSRYPFKHLFRFYNPDSLYRELRRFMGRQQRASDA